MSSTTLVNFRIDAETHRAFKIWCIENNTTLADHLRKMIDDSLDGKAYAAPKRPHKKKEADLSNWLEEWN